MSRIVNELYKKDGCKKQRQNPTTSLASWGCKDILHSFSPELNLWPTVRPCLRGPRLGLKFQQRDFATLMLPRLNVIRKLLNTYINVLFPQIWAFYSSFQKAAFSLSVLGKCLFPTGSTSDTSKENKGKSTQHPRMCFSNMVASLCLLSNLVQALLTYGILGGVMFSSLTIQTVLGLITAR